MSLSVFMNVRAWTSVYSMCTLWCQPCPSGLRSTGSCSLHWVTFLGRALGQSSCLVHLSLPLFFFFFNSVSSRWASLSDSTCNNRVTFLHLLLHPPSRPSFTTTTDSNTHTHTQTQELILTYPMCAHTYHDKQTYTSHKVGIL